MTITVVSRLDGKRLEVCDHVGSVRQDAKRNIVCDECGCVWEGGYPWGTLGSYTRVVLEDSAAVRAAVQPPEEQR